MRLTALSGFGTKGPACFLLQSGGTRLLLDLGRGPDGDALPDLSGVGPVDGIVISHGHADHTGGLHLAGLVGNPPVYAPAAAIALSPEPMMQSATPYDGLDQIAGLPLAIGLCGHAPGARWLRLGGPEGLLYTGDCSEESTLYPYTPPAPAAALVFDASYGTADQPLRDQIAALMALTDRPLLLPVPAGGRGLEMAGVFLAAGLAVALCPDHRRVAETLLGQPAMLAPGGADLLHRLLATTRPLTPDSPAHGVMIAAGPNAERGLSAALAPRFMAESSARVVFTGHLAAGSPSAEWVARGGAEFRRWNVHPTLTGIRALINAVQPRHALPAFCRVDVAADLARALDRPLATEPELTW